MERYWPGFSCLITVVLHQAYVSASADDFRLVGFSNKCAGRVELSNGTRVCSDGWGLDEAMAVCKQLKCAEASAAGSSTFGFGSGKIWLKNVDCSGSKGPLSQCRRSESGPGACPGGDAGVVCSAGVPKPGVSTQPAAQVHFGDTVRIRKETIRGHPTATFTIPNVTFEDEDDYECCYDAACSAVSVTVTVDLPKPNISASSPGQQQRSSSSIQVTKGYSFVIHCSTSAHLPGGQFLLLFSGSNSSVLAPSVQHSASFNFPVTQDQHQGQYSCVHRVEGAGRTYTSPESAVVAVTVTQPLLPIVLPVVAVSLMLLILIGLYFLHRRRRRRRQHVAKITTSTPAPITVMNRYEDSDDEEEADYVNAPNERKDEDSDEPDYVNMTEDNNTVDIYGGDNDDIYQNV
ncbi:uncharacterized protein [Eucyclogobius newberryi]|uniref:uncharacterized protein n=1 Tax=Eucyclogobius newberryi TaxID=166745 RepID=UPI003B5CCD7F